MYKNVIEQKAASNCFTVTKNFLKELKIEFDSIKGLVWMGDGFLQLYKRLEAGSLSWQRTSKGAADLTEEQFRYLMMGLNPLNPKVRESTPQKST